MAGDRSGTRSTIVLALVVSFAWIARADEGLDEARVAMEKGRFVLAERLLRPRVEQDPSAPEPVALLGRALLGQARNAEALKHLERAAQVAPDLPGLSRDLGTVLLRMGEPRRARAALETAVEIDPRDARALMQLGLAELELGEFEAAERRFEQARQVDPALEQITLYNIGVARSRAGDTAGAGRVLREAIEIDATSGAAQRARRVLEASPKPANPKRPWRLSAAAGMLYDDNVSTPEIDRSRDVSDTAATAELSAGYGWRGESPQWRADASYDFMQTSYFDESGANLQLHSGALSTALSSGWADWELGYRYSLVTLGGDRLLEIHELRPNAQVGIGQHWFLLAGPRLQSKDFDDDDRDAKALGLGADLFWFFRQARAWLLVGLEAQGENADSRAFDHDGWQGRVALHLPFQQWDAPHKLDLSYRYQLRDYDSRFSLDPSGLTPGEREDHVHAVRLAVARGLTDHVWLELEYEYTNSDSNLSSIDYRQNSVGLNFEYAF